MIKENDKSLIESVKSFWKEGNTGVHAEQDSFIKHFENSIEYMDGRYTVKLPLKDECKNIPGNFVPASNRLLSLLKRLSNNPEQLKHDTIIKDQERDGIIESVDNPEIIRHGEVHSAPKQLKEKEKRRNYQNDLSIKESLHSGPSLLPKIFGILVRLRSYKCTILSDMQSAFLNIRKAEEDSDFLRFLWVKGIDQKDFE